MRKSTFLLLLPFLLSSCTNSIKNENATTTIEEGTQILTDEHQSDNNSTAPKQLTGFWVGYFEVDDDKEDKTLYVDDAYSWNRNNKINISIDNMTDSLVTGHSVVAGNNRPFTGSVQKTIDPKTNLESYSFQVKEPGDDKYDGTFVFEIKDNQLIGNWVAFKKIDIKKRKFTLEPKKFVYDANIMLAETMNYVNWNKKVVKKEKVEVEDNQFEEWITKEYATATELIYQLNASNKLLEKSQVENLKKGDLTIIRNSIYARHGYSFKNRPLRIFFDAQDWYIPVHTDIKNELTELEKKNITLLLRYEKNAAEYYDSFGRG